MSKTIWVFYSMHTVVVRAKDYFVVSLLSALDADIVATIEPRAVFAMIHVIATKAPSANVALSASIVVRIFDILHPVVGAAVDDEVRIN